MNFVCVRTGSAYSSDYVYKLRNMIARHCSEPHRFLCFTDSCEDLPGIETFDIGFYKLEKWWAKMLLFRPSYRGYKRTIYMDLDTVIVGSLKPLNDWDGKFGICSNFTRAAGHSTWPCKYGSCVMSFAPEFGQFVYDDFMNNKSKFLEGSHSRYGDQWAIEQLLGENEAIELQNEMPKGFFLNKRDLSSHKISPPSQSSIVVFGGNVKPNNCDIPWVREHWR